MPRMTPVTRAWGIAMSEVAIIVVGLSVAVALAVFVVDTARQMMLRTDP